MSDTLTFEATKVGDIVTILPEARTIAQNPLPQMAMTRAKYETMTINSNGDYAFWGKADKLPTDVRRKLKEVPIAMAGIDKLVKMMYGDGLVYYRNSDLYGDEKPKPVRIPEVEAFLKKNRIRTHYLPAQFWDYRLYVNTFSEMTMTEDASKIVELYHKSSEHCRLSLQNQRNLKVEYVYYSPLFAEGISGQREWKKMPLFRWYEAEDFFRWMRGRKFAWLTQLPTPGTTYYAEPPWIGLFKKCGWLDVAANVPKIISAMQQNQIALKYLIRISKEYFVFRHLDWHSYTALRQKEIIDKKLGEIETFLSGAENTYKSIAYVADEDVNTGIPRGLITIDAVDDKTKTGTWVPDSNAADAQIVQSLGLHPSQVGLAPASGKMGAGSGSDQRESFNTAIGLNTLEQELILEPLNFIAEYNGWDVCFKIAHSHHTTTNEVESGVVASDAAPQVE